jgi:hypothetical protein
VNSVGASVETGRIDSTRLVTKRGRHERQGKAHGNRVAGWRGGVPTSAATSSAAREESNWIETVPGKDFYPMMRFYSPKEGLFDGTWKLPDVEVAK